MKEKYNWNLQDIFKNQEEYEKYKKELEEILKQIETLKGTLKESSKNLYTCYNLYEKALEKYEKIYGYGMLKYHLDMSNQESIKLFKEVENIGTEFEKITSFIEPEVSDIDEKILKQYLENDINLNRYKRILKEILEEKEHILTKEEENIIANFSEIFSSSENTYDIFTNSELKYGEIINEEGQKVEMTDGTYSLYLKSKNVEIRKQAFNLMYDTYSKYINTIADLYLTRVKERTITSRLRKYKSSLEKAVKHDDSTIKVYETLIQTINNNLDTNYKFMELKKKLLKTNQLHMYDLYVNPFSPKKDEITFEDAKKEVLDALVVLGEEYSRKLKEAFENRWIDVYEKPNKRSGAYSMGVYGVHPFVLTNFVNSKRDVSTIAHELGHSMHSYYSNTNQNVIDANYTIMVAEVASTVNEILLANYQIENENNKTKKAELIYELLEMIRATFFRQAMFAEFEKIIHEKIEKNEILSSENLNNIYYELNKKYFGNNIIVDEKIKYEWARIPHFYSCFYVYKYSTGIAAAISIATNILNNVEGYKEKYIQMLKKGCSLKSIDLLKLVDVDLESTKPYEDTIKFFNEKTKQLEEIIN